MSRVGHIYLQARSHAGSTSSRSSLQTTQTRDFSGPMPSLPLAGQMIPSPVWPVRDSTHRRASSSVAAMTGPDPTSPLAAMAPLSASKSIDRTTPRSCSLAGEARAKLRASQRRSSRATGSLDLSKSVAENEDMGVYTSFESSSRSVSTTNLHSHQRSASAASPMERTASAPFVHPMRQTPGSFTPSYLALGIHGAPHSESDDDGESDAIAPSPQTHLFPSSPSYPPSARRHRPSITVQTSPSSTCSTSSQTNLRLMYSPAGSSRFDGDDHYGSDAGTPPTDRSSFDSMFDRRHYTHGPAADGKGISYHETMQRFQREYDEAEARATVLQLRREYAEKQRRKDAKLAAKQAKAQAKHERKAKRHSKRESKGSTVTTTVTVANEPAEPEKLPSDRREAVFPSFSEPQDVPSQYHRRFLSTPVLSKPSVEESIREYTPSPVPHPQQPAKRTLKSASNKLGRLRFEATTVWIHSMRSIGVRTRG